VTARAAPLPTLATLAAFLHDALGASAFPAEERGGVFRPGDGRPLACVGVALEPWPGLARWVADAGVDALVLHRPWRLPPNVPDAGVGVAWAHLPFDERLTTGFNPRLADALALDALEPLGERDGRRLGMVGLGAPMPAASWIERVVGAFGGCEATLLPEPHAPVQRVAVVGAMTDALVRAAAARGAGLYVTGQLRHPARAAVADTGIGVIAVGHARAEWWGARALAHLVVERWGAVRAVVADPSADTRDGSRP
jgi:putative NIF3 family GTP cyclohydrolase 1 type 2